MHHSALTAMLQLRSMFTLTSSKGKVMILALQYIAALHCIINIAGDYAAPPATPTAGHQSCIRRWLACSLAAVGAVTSSACNCRPARLSHSTWHLRGTGEPVSKGGISMAMMQAEISKTCTCPVIYITATQHEE